MHRERKESFEKCFSADQEAAIAKEADCPACGSRYQVSLQHDCMKDMNKRVLKLQDELSWYAKSHAALKQFCKSLVAEKSSVQSQVDEGQVKSEDQVYTICPEESD